MPPSAPCHLTMAFEQPLKKRRRYEMFMADGNSETIGKLSPITPAEESESSQRSKLERRGQGEVHQTPVREFAHDDKLKKKRNREEIGSLYTAYRRLKFCLARQDENSIDLKQEMEIAYNSMLELSNGCMSVRRIAAELIPRYAVFCPSALEAASQTTLQLCDWSSAMIWQGSSDSDGIAAETAEACFFGLVHISAAAVTAAPEQSAMGVTCTAVCRNIALYLLRQLSRRDLLAPVKSVAESCPGGIGNPGSTLSGPDRLSRLVSLSLCRVFSVDPEGVLAACFDLLRATVDEERRDGLHFIAEIMKPIDGEIPALPGTADGRVLEPPSLSVKVPALDSTGQGCQPGNSVSPSSMVAKVVHPKPALERWLVSAVRHFRRTVNQELVAEVLPLLFSLLKSLRTFSSSDLELEIEVKDEEKPGQQRGKLINSSHAKLDESPTSQHEAWWQASQVSAEGESWNREKKYSNGVHKRETGFSKGEDVPSPWDGDCRLGRRGGSREHDKFPGAEEEAWSKRIKDQGNGIAKEEVDGSLSSSLRQGRSGNPKDSEKMVPSDGEAWVRSKSSIGVSRKDLTVSVSALLPSPQQPSTPQPQASSPSRGWYSDGDPAAMDVFAASQHLWVGALGPGVTDTQLRFHFEKFGPVEGVSLFRSRDFALIDFRTVRDAVKAREVMQGAMTWGKPVQIKFLDAGLGTRGTMGGVAVGGSCHVWVGGISSQNAKEEILKDVTGAGLKAPRSVFALVNASAILLEFEAPEEATAVMLHIRQRRKEGGGLIFSSKVGIEKTTAVVPTATSGEHNVGGNRHLWVGRIDSSIREEELLSSFSKFGDLTGWKFIRSSGCCFIDFRLPECAAVAKTQLNGTRFGIQCIVVEFKNTPQNRNSSVPLLSSPPQVPPLLHSPSLGGSGSRFGVSPSLTAALNALQSKLLQCSGIGGVPPSRLRSSRGGGREVTERVPTNTLWIGLPDVVGPNFMNEMELKNIFTLASAGVGGVTKVRSARTSRGPCRFVEFDRVEAAAAALRNVSGRVDPSIQIEFSNSAISLQQSEHPHLHTQASFGHSLMSLDDIRRRGWDHQRDKESSHLVRTREHETDDVGSPTVMNFEEAKTSNAEAHPSQLTGFGGRSEKELVDDGYIKVTSDLREDTAKGDSGTPKAKSFGGFRGGVNDLPGSNHSSPVPSSHSLLGKKPSLDRQSSTAGSVVRPPLPPPGATLAPLPVLKHPPWLHSDRVPPTSSWSGGLMTLPSSPLGQISPTPGMKSVLGGLPLANVPYGGQKLVQGIHNAVPLLQSPVTPGLCNLPLAQSLEPLGQSLDRPAQSVGQSVQPFDLMVCPLVDQLHQPIVRSIVNQPLDHTVASVDPLTAPHGDHSSHLDLLNPPLPPLPPVSPPPPPPCETPPPPPPFSPPLPPPPSSPPPPLPPPPADSLPEAVMKGDAAHMLREKHWRGPLCKSGMQYCEVMAFHQDSAACHYEQNLQEPIEWPMKLDVTKRADFKSVKNTFNSTPLSQREVCRLFVSPGAENHDGFQQFISYLKQRERAGVVKIGAGESMWPRMLYILPWSVEACSLLAISPQPTNCLLGLMLPSLATFG